MKIIHFVTYLSLCTLFCIMLLMRNIYCLVALQLGWLGRRLTAPHRKVTSMLQNVHRASDSLEAEENIWT